MAQEAASPPSPVPLPTPGAGPRIQEPRRGLRPDATIDDGVELDGSVPLERLLDVAVLTPAQAAYVAIELLTSASTIGLGRRSDVRVTPPLVTPDGRLYAVPATDPSRGVEVDDVLAQLVDNARRLPSHPRVHQVGLLRRLEEIARSFHEPAARALMLREALHDALGQNAETRVAGELAALVAAFAELADERGVPIDTDTPFRHRPPPSTTSFTRRELGRRRTRKTGRRTALAVLACLVAAAGAYYVFGVPGSGGTGHHTPRTPKASAPTTAASPHGGTHHRAIVPVLAGPTAGPITHVDLQRFGACRPGSLCPVRVTVSLTPATVTQTVGWRVGVVMGCTRNVAWSPVTAVTAQPGWTHVYASSSVRVPPGHPFALIAVTTTPERAQSPPARLATSAPRC